MWFWCFLFWFLLFKLFFHDFDAFCRFVEWFQRFFSDFKSLVSQHKWTIVIISLVGFVISYWSAKNQQERYCHAIQSALSWIFVAHQLCPTNEVTFDIQSCQKVANSIYNWWKYGVGGHCPQIVKLYHYCIILPS